MLVREDNNRSVNQELVAVFSASVQKRHRISNETDKKILILILNVTWLKLSYTSCSYLSYSSVARV